MVVLAGAMAACARHVSHPVSGGAGRHASGRISEEWPSIVRAKRMAGPAHVGWLGARRESGGIAAPDPVERILPPRTRLVPR